jgi:outer membrane protein assembly factor BamB
MTPASNPSGRTDSTRAAACLFACLCALLAIGAAPPAPPAQVIQPAWSAAFQEPILWERVTPLGRLVVCTPGALHGVEPESGKVVWRHPALGGTPEDAYLDDAASSLIQMREKGQGRQPGRLTVLDAVDGKIVFDSQTAKIATVLTARVLHRAGALLIVGVRPDGSNQMMLLDTAAGGVTWSRDLKPAWAVPQMAGFPSPAPGASPQMTGLAAAMMRGLGGMTASAKTWEIGPDAFLYVDYGSLAKIDTRTGRVLWQTIHRGAPDSTRLFFPPDRDDLLVLGSELQDSINGAQYPRALYMAHRMTDGKALWSEPVELKDGLGEVIFADHGILISNTARTDGRIKMVEYPTGRSIWGKKGKGIETPGTVYGHHPVAGGLAMAFGADSAWDNAGVEYVLNILDLATGEFRFKNDLKVKGSLIRTELLPRGILYVTTAEMNVLDTATGKPVNPRLVVSDGRLVTADTGRQVYAFAHDTGLLHRLDKESGRMGPHSKTPVRLGDKDRPDLLEVGNDRVTVISSQNVVAFGLDGSVKFHAHHAAPRQPAALRILAAANAFNAAMTAAASAVMGGAMAHATTNQEPGSPAAELTGLIAEGYGQVADDAVSVARQSAQIASARFKASRLAGTHLFMLVNFPHEGIGLAKVSKATGAIDGRIMLGKDREPSYQVDVVGRRLFYRAAHTQILGYAF